MNTETLEKNAGFSGPVDDKAIADEYVWATSEEARQQAVSLYLIHSIAQRYGGKAQIDFDNYSINLDVPNEQKLACLQEIERKVDLNFN
jgi:hypothetical protein